MSHEYGVFQAAPMVPEADMDEPPRPVGREQFANRSDEVGQDYAAALVRSERTDGGWP